MGMIVSSEELPEPDEVAGPISVYKLGLRQDVTVSVFDDSVLIMPMGVPQPAAVVRQLALALLAAAESQGWE
jgi:hypothetical protein